MIFFWGGGQCFIVGVKTPTPKQVKTYIEAIKSSLLVQQLARSFATDKISLLFYIIGQTIIMGRLIPPPSKIFFFGKNFRNIKIFRMENKKCWTLHNKNKLFWQVQHTNAKYCHTLQITKLYTKLFPFFAYFPLNFVLPFSQMRFLSQTILFDRRS